MAMNNEPVEDVFPIEHGDIPASYVSIPEGTNIIHYLYLSWNNRTFLNQTYITILDPILS